MEKIYKTLWDIATDKGIKQCPECEGYGFVMTQGKLATSNKQNK